MAYNFRLPQSALYAIMSTMSQAFSAGVASQTRDDYLSRPPSSHGLMNVHYILFCLCDSYFEFHLLVLILIIFYTHETQLSRMCFVGTDSDSVWSVNHSALELPCVMADLSFTSNNISVLTALYKFKHS